MHKHYMTNTADLQNRSSTVTCLGDVPDQSSLPYSRRSDHQYGAASHHQITDHLRAARDSSPDTASETNYVSLPISDGTDPVQRVVDPGSVVLGEIAYLR